MTGMCDAVYYVRMSALKELLTQQHIEQQFNEFVDPVPAGWGLPDFCQKWGHRKPERGSWDSFKTHGIYCGQPFVHGQTSPNVYYKIGRYDSITHIVREYNRLGIDFRTYWVIEWGDVLLGETRLNALVEKDIENVLYPHNRVQNCMREMFNYDTSHMHKRTGAKEIYKFNTPRDMLDVYHTVLQHCCDRGYNVTHSEMMLESSSRAVK